MSGGRAFVPRVLHLGAAASGDMRGLNAVHGPAAHVPARVFPSQYLYDRIPHPVRPTRNTSWLITSGT